MRIPALLEQDSGRWAAPGDLVGFYRDFNEGSMGTQPLSNWDPPFVSMVVFFCGPQDVFPLSIEYTGSPLTSSPLDSNVRESQATPSRPTSRKCPLPSHLEWGPRWIDLAERWWLSHWGFLRSLRNRSRRGSCNFRWLWTVDWNIGSQEFQFASYPQLRRVLPEGPGAEESPSPWVI